jgi:uncharacterized membrane protein (UPF0127 family)
MKTVFKTLCIVIVAIFSFMTKTVFPYSQGKVCFKEQCFEVTIAASETELNKGLQGKDSLEENSGMLFSFPEPGIYHFWMKDTLIALDMIWLDEERRVLFVQENTLPCLEEPCPLYGPQEEALYVLEVNADIARKLGIEKGDQLTIFIADVLPK